MGLRTSPRVVSDPEAELSVIPGLCCAEACAGFAGEGWCLGEM